MAQQNKDEQKKLLIEIMEADQKNGLYDHIGNANKMVTAVEWLAKELESYGNPQVCEINWEVLDALINQAKQMEKEQLDKAYYQGQESKCIGGPSYCEQYYNDTYGKK